MDEYFHEVGNFRTAQLVLHGGIPEPPNAVELSLQLGDLQANLAEGFTAV